VPLFFVQNPNRVITKDELLKAVWVDSFLEEGNLTQNVFLLRKALGQKFEDSGLIVTIPRKGYQFGADVTVVTQTAQPSSMLVGQDAATAVSPAAGCGTGNHSPASTHSQVTFRFNFGNYV
jgi:DNA-binding winged helix-turn-helix (wHTH) protein